jgi:hypothetical protein
MIRAAFALSLSLALGAGALTDATVGALTLKTPGDWQRRDAEGTVRFADASGEAFFDVDVGTVQRKGGMKADECLKKILAGIGKSGFKKTKVGGQPAASKETVDTDEAGKKFVERTYVGCNGTTTWSIQFHMVEEKKGDYAPLADQVFKSIRYEKK